MNLDELERLRKENTGPIKIKVEDVPGPDRTLVFGYTVERNSFHVYKLEGQLHVVIYDHYENIVSYVFGEEVQASACSPDKRAYPESCDYEFARLLRRHEVYTAYLPFSQERYELVWEKQFHGLVV